MLRRVPTDLPLFGALLFGLCLVSFGFAGMYTEVAIGRPSSTSGLGFFFIPIWGGLAAVAGLVLGFVVRAVWHALKRSEAETNTSALRATLACAVVAAAAAGALSVVHYEQAAEPRVRLDGGLLVREFRADLGKPVRTSTVLYDSDKKTATLSWGGNTSELVIDDDQVLLRDTTSCKNARFATAALDYITRVDAVPVLAEQGPSLLAIVICGRATGRRAIVATVDENYQVIFEEQVKRFWQLSDTPVEVRAGSEHDEYVVVGPYSYESLVLRRKPQH